MVEGRQRVTGRVVLGLIVMVVGALWTLDNFNILESEPIIQWWPILLIGVGLAKLLGLWTRRHTIWGITFVAVGSWLLLDALQLVDVRLWQLWPVALIALGLSLISRAWNPMAAARDGADASSTVNVFSFWSHIVRRVTSQSFRGGEITTVMAGADLDLRHARAAEGGAVIDLFAWWGAVIITVPETWKVVTEATVIMGGVDDKTKVKPAEQSDTLIIRGLVVMGGIEIKDA